MEREDLSGGTSPHLCLPLDASLPLVAPKSLQFLDPLRPPAARGELSLPLSSVSPALFTQCPTRLSQVAGAGPLVTDLDGANERLPVLGWQSPAASYRAQRILNGLP